MSRSSFRRGRSTASKLGMFLGLVMMFAGIVFGVWAGLWWAFIGGIVDVINEVKAPTTDALNLAIGVAKFMFAGVIGWVCGVVAILPGYALLEGSR